MMIRRAIPRLKQAASIICKEGNPTTFTQITPLRATPVSFSPALPSYGGRSLSSKVPAGRPMTPSPSASKDKAQEAIDKAEQLHAELNEMIAAQKARQIEEAQRPFGSEFVAFLKKSKPEIVNIIFAFVCVLLAYQIHGMRAGIKKLLAAQEEKNAEIDRLRGLLAMLSEEENKNGDNDESEQVENQSDTFSMRLADKCVSVVRRIFAESEQSVGYSWILGRKIASGDAMEVERLLDELQPIVLSEIQSVVGDAAYTPDELKERRVAALKEQNVDALESLGSSQDVNKHSAQLSGLMEVLEEVHKADLSDEGDLTTGDALVEDGSATSAKVKRTRYAI